MCNRPGGVPALIFLLRSPAPKPKNRTDQSCWPECEKRYAPGTTAAAPSKRAAAGSAIESDQEITKEPIEISLSIGRVSFHYERIGVWDVNKILPEDLPRLDGILSLKTFLDQPFTIDLSSKHLILETKESLEDRTSTMTRLESRIATGPNGNELTIFLQGKIRELRM